MAEKVDLNLLKEVQNSLGKHIKKPPLTDKLLSKPPFRFLHDIISEVNRGYKMFDGVFTKEEMDANNVKDKDSKIKFLQKLIDETNSKCGTKLDVRPSKIAAGLEVNKTLALLQAITYALDKNNNQSKKTQSEKKGEKKIGNKAEAKDEIKKGETKKINNEKSVDKIEPDVKKNSISKKGNVNVKNFKEPSRSMSNDRKKSLQYTNATNGSIPANKKNANEKNNAESSKQINKDVEKRKENTVPLRKEKAPANRRDSMKPENDRIKMKNSKDSAAKKSEEKSEKPVIIAVKNETTNEEAEKINSGNERIMKKLEEDQTRENENHGEIEYGEKRENKMKINVVSNGTEKIKSERKNARKVDKSRRLSLNEKPSNEIDGHTEFGEKEKNEIKKNVVNNGTEGVKSERKHSRKVDKSRRLSLNEKPSNEKDGEIECGEKEKNEIKKNVVSNGKEEIKSERKHARKVDKSRRLSLNEKPSIENDEKASKVAKTIEIPENNSSDAVKDNERENVVTETEKVIEKNLSKSVEKKKEMQRRPSSAGRRPSIANLNQVIASANDSSTPKPKPDSKPISHRLGGVVVKDRGVIAEVKEFEMKHKGVAVIEDGDQDGELDDAFITVEKTPKTIASTAQEIIPNVDESERGKLVDQIIEVQKQLDSNNVKRNSDLEEEIRKIREASREEMESLKKWIQAVTSATYPLAKLTGYLQQDLSEMRKELERWKRVNKELEERYSIESNKTSTMLEPVKAEINEVEIQIENTKELIRTAELEVLENEMKFFEISNV